MSEVSAFRLLLMRVVFAALALLILLAHLLPLETNTRSWAAPDLLLSLAFCWCMRRPEYLPLPLICAVFLLADFLLQRPPGLWALTAMLACEYLKGRSRSLRDMSFLAEWSTVALLFVLVALANRLVHAIVLIPNPQLQLQGFAVLMTILCYPIVVGINYLVLGIRKSAPGDLDTTGQRI